MEQQPKHANNAKKNIFAIISFILGVVEIAWIISFTVNFDLYIRSDFRAQLLSMLIVPLVGLIFGIIGLNSTYRKFSIIGIIICSIPFLEVIYLQFFILTGLGVMR